MGISNINLGSMLRRSAHKHPQKVALVSHEGVERTYLQLEALSNRVARAFTKLGIKKGDHVAVLSLNCIEELIAFFGIFKLGAVVVPINVRLAAPEMKWIIEHSDATSLIYSKDFETLALELRPGFKKIEHYLLIGEDPPENTLCFKDVLEMGEDDAPQTEVTGDDEAFLLYTAGTTGRPKGVLLSHNCVIWNSVNWVHNGVYRQDDRCLQVFPLYHVAAIGSVLTYLYVGGTVYLKKTFDPKDCMETIARARITRWAAAPTVFSMLLQLPGIEEYDTGSVTLIGSGAAIMPVETQRRLGAVFPSAAIFDTYGMTESSGGITTLLPGDFSHKNACVGKEHLNLELRVVDENGSHVPVGHVGEVIFRGSNLMKGYYKDAVATETSIRDGWFYTGDLGRLDKEGFLYIVDRKKDMIITGGENVYPREVEEVLYTHPRIAEAAVIGVPDPRWGEAIKAVVALEAGVTVSEREIIAFCRKKIGGFKCPKSVEFVHELPKNPAGKILKKELRKRFSILPQ
ncbi:MAG: long-chain-fatty-acid--CoA ligase [Desulfobacteraceae bacterium]|nr:long-chain-fatty-acid--CoA ligase [Desulfobacteraceae bacterium]